MALAVEQRLPSSSFNIPNQFDFVHRQTMWQLLTQPWGMEQHVPASEPNGQSQQTAATSAAPAINQLPFIVVLTGLGGIGKSQLALHYALTTGPAGRWPSPSPSSSSTLSLPSYSLRAWFDASSADRLQSAYLTFATVIPAPTRHRPLHCRRMM